MSSRRLNASTGLLERRWGSGDESWETRAMESLGRIEVKGAPQSRPVESDKQIYDDGVLRVEHENYYVACRGTPLKLPRTEFLIISRLARSAGRIVTAEDLWSSAWGNEKAFNPESLHVHIYRLRNKLMPYSIVIDTMVNVGYKLLAGR